MSTIRKLRGDLAKKLKGVGLLLINCGALCEVRGKGALYCGSSALEGALKGLRDVGVRVRFFIASGGSEREKLTRVVGDDCALFEIPLDSPRTSYYREVKRELSLEDREIALFGYDRGDIPLMELAGFSAVPSSAELEVKSRAYYVAYGDSLQSLVEVAAVIRRAKLPAP